MGFGVVVEEDVKKGQFIGNAYGEILECAPTHFIFVACLAMIA
jgi:hypothetical protein